MSNINGLRALQESFKTLNSRDGKYSIVLQFPDGDEAFAGFQHLAEYLRDKQACPGHGRAECVTCCWPAKD